MKIYDELEIKDNLVLNSEYYLSLVIFIKNIYPQKKIIIKNKYDNLYYNINDINYKNLYSIKFETERYTGHKDAKRACLFLKEIDHNNPCNGATLIIY